MPGESEVYLWPNIPETREQIFPGVVIEGFGDRASLAEFDILLEGLARIVIGNTYQHLQVRFPGQKNGLISDVITAAARSRKLHGLLVPDQAIILPSDGDTLDQENYRGINLTLKTAALASGLGRVAFLQHNVQLPVQHERSPRFVYIFSARAQVATVETNRSAKSFLATSAKTYTQVTGDALRHPWRGGRPESRR